MISLLGFCGTIADAKIRREMLTESIMCRNAPFCPVICRYSLLCLAKKHYLCTVKG